MELQLPHVLSNSVGVRIYTSGTAKHEIVIGFVCVRISSNNKQVL